MVGEIEYNLICVFGQIALLILYMITFHLADEIENECSKYCILFSVQVVIKARSQNASSYCILITSFLILKGNSVLLPSAESKTSKIFDLRTFKS